MRKNLTIITLALLFFAGWFGIAWAQVDPRDSVILESKTVAPSTNPPDAAVLMNVWITNKDTLSEFQLLLEEISLSGGAYLFLAYPRTFSGVVNPQTITLQWSTSLTSNQYDGISPDRFRLIGDYNPVDLSTAEPPNAARKLFWQIKFDTVIVSTPPSSGQVSFDSARNNPSDRIEFLNLAGTRIRVNFVPSVITVNANQPPVLAAIGPKSTNESQLLEFRVSATDPDLTTPALSAVNLSSGATFTDSLNGAGSFNWTPSFIQSGVYNVTFIASDGSLADSEVVTITVNNVNQTPVLDPIGAKSTNENQLLEFRVSASDPDATTPALNTVGLPLGATFTDSLNGAGSFNWTPSFTQSGAYNVSFIASDGSLADSEVVAITVNEAGNQAPVLAAIGPKSTNEIQLLEFRISASDPDLTTPSLSAANLPPGAAFVDSLNGAGSFNWTPSYGQAGSYGVTFIASDGFLADSEVVTITVNNVNQPPVLASIGSKNTNETQLLEFRVSATDPDSTIPSLSAVNFPSGAAFFDSLNGAGGFSWTPTFGQAGLYNVTFVASDGFLADSEVVAITVDSIATDVGEINTGAIPRRYSLSQNYPNPFNANTQIIFALPKSGLTRLKVFNLLGQRVITLVDEYLSAGTKIVRWDGCDERGATVPSGIYFYQIQSRDFVQKKKMVFLK